MADRGDEDLVAPVDGAAARAQLGVGARLPHDRLEDGDGDDEKKQVWRPGIDSGWWVGSVGGGGGVGV